MLPFVKRSLQPPADQSVQQSTPPLVESVLVALVSSPYPSLPHDQGVPNAPQRSPLVRFSPVHPLPGVLPSVPQPNKSLLPTPQFVLPGPLCWLAKNTEPEAAVVAPVQDPEDDLATTCAAEVQMCQPVAQRSTERQPVPVVLLLELPETRLQAGELLVMPAMDQPPEQPAMFGYVAGSVNPSRVPSLQPEAAHVRPLPL